MASERFLMKIVYVEVHYLAECHVCGTVASVLIRGKPNVLERFTPHCGGCGAEIEPEPDTVYVDVRMEACR